MTIQIKPEIENLNLVVAFYYDKDGDGKWSGYEIDPTSSWSYSQARLGWDLGKWYKIYQGFPKADYPIIQIAVVAMGDNDGTLTLADFEMFGEVASQG